MIVVWYIRLGERKGYSYKSPERLVTHAAQMVLLGWKIDPRCSSFGQPHQHCDCCDGECGA
jgi:hypothetical protein